MTISASILVSYSPDGGYRDVAWSWVKRRWESQFPDYPMYLGASVGVNGFQQTAAANKAASQSDEDVYVFTDCDTVTDSEWIREAVEQVGSGEIPWALYSRCHKLDRESTVRILESDPVKPIIPYTTEYSNSNLSVGGILVVPRIGFEEVGGYDERFIVWGPYDSCFSYAMDALWGDHVRFDSTIYHLWHPFDNKELFGHPAQSEQQRLTQRYTQAKGTTKEAMREVRFG